MSKTKKALIVASLSAGGLLCTLLAQYWPIPAAVVGLWITAFAASMDLHLFTPTDSAPPPSDSEPWRHSDGGR